VAPPGEVGSAGGTAASGGLGPAAGSGGLGFATRENAGGGDVALRASAR
jgi:hypothetical protein